MLKRDLQRAYDMLSGSRLRRILECIASPGVQAVAVLRLGQWLKARPLFLRLAGTPLYLLLHYFVQTRWGIAIPRSARIGPGFYIGHFGGIHISGEARIGADCNIAQNVTIGLSGQGEQCGVPCIGDNVYIGPGAKLFGKITIGDNVKIGANAVVYKDIPDNAVVVLDPGHRIISFKGNAPVNRADKDLA